LKRGVAAAKFDSQKTQSAEQSATLSAIAASILTDTRAVKNPADTDKWYKFSADMRDAAGSVNAAVHAGDQAATATAMSQLAKSCEACHAVFRKER
jgi:cytochrome c556